MHIHYKPQKPLVSRMKCNMHHKSAPSTVNFVWPNQKSAGFGQASSAHTFTQSFHWHTAERKIPWKHFSKQNTSYQITEYITDGQSTFLIDFNKYSQPYTTFNKSTRWLFGNKFLEDGEWKGLIHGWKPVNRRYCGVKKLGAHLETNPKMPGPFLQTKCSSTMAMHQHNMERTRRKKLEQQRTHNAC